MPSRDDRLAAGRHALVVEAEGAEAAGRGRVGGDVHVLGAVAQRAEVVRLEEARAGVGGLGAVDAVELGRVADRLVHLQRHLLGVDHDRRHPGRARRRAQERGRLLADARRLALEAERLDVLPAGLGARAAVRARVAADLRRPRRARPSRRFRRRTRRAPARSTRRRRRRTPCARAGRGPSAEVTLTSSCASACSARRQRSTLSASGTANGSRSTGVRNSPRAGSSGRELAAVPARRRLGERGRLAAPPPRRPPGRAAGRRRSPRRRPTSTRTPMPSVSWSSSRSTRPFLVPTTCERRTTTRASAYEAPAPSAAATACSQSSRTGAYLSARRGSDGRRGYNGRARWWRNW